MEKRRNKLFIFLVLTGTMVLACLVVYSSLSLNSPAKMEEKTKEVEAEEVYIPKEETSEISSPDGKAVLIVENTELPHGNTEQIFSVRHETDGETLDIYTEESDEDNYISVPFNVFSPDNKFIFLKAERLGDPEYLLFRTDGIDLKGGVKFVEITSLFSEQHPDYIITEITGWGSYSQLIINTNNTDGSKGPSWWLHASSLSFQKLNTRFD